jgi:hypothetical protein
MAKQNKNKSNKAAKQKAYRLQAAPTTAPLPPTPTTQDSEDAELGIDPEDLEIAVNVLSTLVEDPEALMNQRYKRLKSAGWDLAKVLQEQGAAGGHAGMFREVSTTRDSDLFVKAYQSTPRSRISSRSHYTDKRLSTCSTSTSTRPPQSSVPSNDGSVNATPRVDRARRLRPKKRKSETSC